MASIRHCLLWLTIVWTIAVSSGQRLKPKYTEEFRQEEYRRRGHSWPPQIYPDSEGWKQILKQRFDQVRALEDVQMKWDGFIQTLTASIMKNYTEYGWGLTRAPEVLTAEIRKAIFDGLPTAGTEGDVDVIDGPPPRFIERPDLTAKSLKMLQPILEAWSGIDLQPSIAYGFRLYGNESRLWMHVDRTQTHVISCIYHIASSEDSEPWPIIIEDYAGKTNSVILKPGDILLYESAKNFHGRPTHFKGDYYTSLFVHFYPKDPEWSKHDHDLDSHYAIPPDWDRVIPSAEPRVIIQGTSMMMPDCPDAWCPLAEAVEYEGPGVFGVVLTGGGKKYSLNLDKKEEEKEL